MSTLFGGQQLTQPSLFNSSFNAASSQQQQQNQQQQQQQQSQQQQSQQQPQQQQPQLFNTQQHQQQQQHPIWLQNQKKRTIPNHLVPKKKQSFQLGTTNNNNKLNSKNKNKNGKNRSNNGNVNGGDSIISNDNDEGQFNLLSFGSKLNRRVTSGSGSGSLLDRNTSIASLFDNSIGDLSRIDDSFIVGGDNTVDDINDDGIGGGDGFGNDLPPKNSMYDLSIGGGRTTRDKNGINSDSKFESFINKDPKSFDSVFNKFQEFTPILDPNNINTNNTNGTSNSGNRYDDDKLNPINSILNGGNSSTRNDLLQNQKHYNLAIIVFGYPEYLSIEIIKFFQSFGRILEKFDTTSITSTNNNNNIKEVLINLANTNNNNNTANKIVPIFSGKHWIKLTFDNPNSALQALQENGNVFNGSIIGVVPYHKSIIEKLENRKIFINDDNDIGLGNLDIPLDKINQIINQQSKLVSNGGAATTPNNFINNNNGSSETVPTATTGGSLYNRLDIKPISKDQIFLKDNINGTTTTNGGDSQKVSNIDGNKTTDNKEKLGVWGNLSKYIFGFHDL